MLPISADKTLITSSVAVACLRSYSVSYALEKLESTELIWGEISNMKTPQKFSGLSSQQRSIQLGSIYFNTKPQKSPAGKEVLGRHGAITSWRTANAT